MIWRRSSRISMWSGRPSSASRSAGGSRSTSPWPTLNVSQRWCSVAPELSGFHFSSDPTDDSSWAADTTERLGGGRQITGYAVATWLRQCATPSSQRGSASWRKRNGPQWLENSLLERPLRSAAIDRLDQIRTAPTLIIVGNKDVDDIHEIVGLLRIRIPSARLTIVPDAGHIVNLEAPALFDRTVVGFLAETAHTQ